MMKKVVLVIRDGWGIAAGGEYNAVANALTPNVDAYLKEYPNTILEAAGSAVGLPEGYQGSSEVGHLNMGAGRIVKQELARINDSIGDGTFSRNKNFREALANCIKHNSALHLMGLVQDEGVHAHQDHLFELLKYAKCEKINNVYIHFFSDGRDTPPRSAKRYLSDLKKKMKSLNIGTIGTLIGRYYAMDRGENWYLTDKAYNAITKAEGIKVDSAEEAIERGYENDSTPDGAEMYDEYLLPSIINGYPGVKDGDSIIHFNYRQDRAIQLTQAFVESDYPGSRQEKLNVVYCGLTKYYDSFQYNILDSMDDSAGMSNLLGELISRKGLKQLRVSETQKFKHVTSFFNGKVIAPFKGEDRIEVKSGYDPSMFAKHPEMNAYDIAESVVKEIEKQEYTLIVLNFANCDMVGHTGNYKAAVEAVRVVDECVGRVVTEALAKDNVVLLTADHGNAEEMFDYENNVPKTAHTKNPVEFVYIAKEHKDIRLKESGILSDIAPTILYLLNIEKPVEMTADNLIMA